MQEIIYSVGIDIGTSTTQLIFSKLTIENLSNSYSVPRIHIVDKEVIYKSDVYFTPLREEKEIDAVGVKKIIENEYKKAGFTASDLQTGAVIITGETARKNNAAEVLDELSSMAGDFVVATAGPDLESVLSARGAGADLMSKENVCTVANIDIGGGTSNIAIYSVGRLVAVSCLDIGGRLIKIKDGKITYIYEKIKNLANEKGININVGENVDTEKIKKITEFMADHLAQAVNLTVKNAAHAGLYTNDGKAISDDISIDAVTFSGGVADYVYHDSDGDTYKYGDIGVVLGNAVKRNEDFKKVRLLESKETLRATVVGAGTHTTEVSGSTVSFIKKELPIKNLPVLKLSESSEISFETIENEIREGIDLFEVNGVLQKIAIGFDGYNFFGFRETEELAEAIIRGAKRLIDLHYPLIVILENDIAKALGNSLRVRLNDAPVICLDSIHTNDGDYIDIGEPLSNGSVVPVITKTLIFNT